MATAYDLLRYPTFPYALTHPSRVAAIAAVCGRDVPSARACRVLEVGCGDGNNLLAMAVSLPESEFVGIDLAETAVASAAETARAAGLANVRFLARDIAEENADLGSFDFVVSHGVYAWVPEHVRSALLRLVSRVLTPDGLAVISYNVAPGCGLRQVLRSIMLDAARDQTAPAARIEAAHAALRGYVAAWSDSRPFQHALKEEASDLLEKPAEVLFHDELGPCFEPQLFSDVVGAASQVGLDYVFDMHHAPLIDAAFPSERFEAARPATGGDWIRFEQMDDFSSMRPFRNSVFGRAGRPMNRGFQPARLAALQIGASLRAAEPAEPGTWTFRTADGGRFSTRDEGLASFLLRVADAAPATVPLLQVADRAEVLKTVMTLFLMNIVSLWSEPVALVTSAGAKPTGSALARLQAARGDALVSTLLHRSLTLEDPATREVLVLLSGDRSREDVARALAASTGCSLEVALERTNGTLKELARLALLSA